MLNILDKIIEQVDLGLKTILLPHQSSRDIKFDNLSDAELTLAEKNHSVRLMRINHCGEISAQALYRAQSLLVQDQVTADVMRECAEEEIDHLAWCEERVSALGGRLSYLRPAWYVGSFMIGVVAGLAGDKYNLGFIDETERQVEEHLASHLAKVSAKDLTTIAVIEQMRTDEAKHGATARDLGAAELPAPIPFIMQMVARVMTRTAYYI
jgi:ubiquinone biosynthesis monooxygenase Coq7